MPWKHGRGYWAWAPLQDGGRKRVPLGTNDLKMAREIETMLGQLKGKREWMLLEAAANGPISPGGLHDYWVKGPDGLVELRALLTDRDLNQYVEQWSNWAKRRASATTVARYEAQLRALISAEQPFPRSKFTRKGINEALSKLPGSGSTARRYHAAWSSFAKYLVEIEVLEANPLRAVSPPRNNPSRDLYLSLEDSKRLVEAHPEPYRALAALREGAGVEISAAMKVCRRDVDERDRSVHVHGSKNAWRSRPVLVEDWAWPYVSVAIKGKLPAAPIFIEADGTGATYPRARAAHLAALKALGLPPSYTMHDARHSFAVRGMKAGLDPQVIASNLGHRDATMVLRNYGRYRISREDISRARTGTGGQ